MTTPRRRCASLVLAAISCAALHACTRAHPPTPAGTAATGATALDRSHELVLAVGPRKIDVAELGRLLGPPPQRRERRSESERRADFLAELERTELLAVEADRRGYSARPEVQQAKKNLMVQQLLDDLFGEHGSTVTPVSDADVRAYYDAHVAEFSSPAQARASQIVVRSELEARKLIELFTTHPEQRAHFPELARKRSLDKETSERGGDLGNFTRVAPPAPDATTRASMRPRAIADAVREAAFTLEQPGAIYPTPIHSELGFAVLMLTLRRPASRYELGQVEHLIRERLGAERREAALDALLKRLEAGAAVQRYPEKLALIHVAP